MRIRFACAVASSWLAMSALSASAEEWPRWRGQRGDGSWHAPALPDTWPKQGLRRVWRQELGGGYAGVSVAGGRVFTMDRRTEPHEVERVLCFDAATGKPLWKHEYPVEYGKLDYGNGPRAAPTVQDGRVYTLGAVGHVQCLDAATGQAIWSNDMVRDYKARVPEWGFAASPVLFENLVVIHTGAEPNGSFIAFDRQSGKEVWRNVADPAGYCTPIIVENHGQAVMIVWTPEAIRALEPRTGTLLWSIPYKVTYGVSIATPIFREGIVFVTGYWEGSKAIRLGPKPTDHELVWEDNRWLRGLMSQPLYRDGYAYSLDKHHGLICFELKSGQKIWDDGHRMTPKGRNPQASMVWLVEGDRSQPAAESDGSAGQGRANESAAAESAKQGSERAGRAIILNSDGDLILARLDPTGYHEQSRVNIIQPTESNRIWAHPAYAGRFVYARNDVELVCVSLVEPAE